MKRKTLIILGSVYIAILALILVIGLSMNKRQDQSSFTQTSVSVSSGGQTLALGATIAETEVSQLTPTEIPTKGDETGAVRSPTLSETSLLTSTTTPSPSETLKPTATQGAGGQQTPSTKTSTPNPTSTSNAYPVATGTPIPTATGTTNAYPVASNTTIPTISTNTRTLTPTQTQGVIGTSTQTRTPTPTNTNTRTPTHTNTITHTPTPTSTNTRTTTSTNTATHTASPTPQTGWEGDWVGYLQQADGSFLDGVLTVTRSGEEIIGTFELPGETMTITGNALANDSQVQGSYSRDEKTGTFVWLWVDEQAFRGSINNQFAFCASRSGNDRPDPCAYFIDL